MMMRRMLGRRGVWLSRRRLIIRLGLVRILCLIEAVDEMTANVNVETFEYEATYKSYDKTGAETWIKGKNSHLFA